MLTSDIFNKTGTEESAESLKTTEATGTAERTTNLESRKIRGDLGLENQTTSSPGR